MHGQGPKVRAWTCAQLRPSSSDTRSVLHLDQNSSRNKPLLDRHRHNTLPWNRRPKTICLTCAGPLHALLAPLPDRPYLI